MAVNVSNNPDKAVEDIYQFIKNAYDSYMFNVEHIEAIAEMTTELAARLKETESE